jgi:dihydrofolate synthase/folylpolyglutamate synthase
MYSSPHLVSITERVKVDGVDVSEIEFARLAAQVRVTAERLVENGDLESIPTFFEQVTAIALLAFAEAKVELAILETGLGGRLDATTAANAEIAAITRIDLDHQQYLGETMEEIAAEKAAIIRREEQAVVIGAQESRAGRIILDRCKQVGIDLSWEPHLRWEVDASDDSTVRVATHRYVYKGVKLGLPGRHQVENAETAINVVRTLRYGFGIQIDDEHVIEGLSRAHHPGRLEHIGQFLFDGAHNIGGARALRNYLDEFVDVPITMILGAMTDKDVGEIGSILFPKASRLIFTRPDNSRAMSAEDILEFVPERFDRDRVFVTPNATAAIDRAREVSGTQDVILVTGSLYLVGEVQRLLPTRFPEKLKTNN